MSLDALIELTKLRKAEDPHIRSERLAASRDRLRQYDLEIEQRIAAEVVSHELLAKTCNL